MKERFWINRLAGEICFQPLHSDTGPLLILREAQFSARNAVTWHLPVDTSKFFFFRKIITVTKKIENAQQPIIEFCLQSNAIEDAGHEALWLAG